ncbi:MAG: hypothetical protein A2928_03800 [Candidatus Taylorbacteria bacterium RIFCSPLOWO2_01_FULL_45_15b]|uniref:Uncharacterized protein n=1 Tax=Candidatus Taylorbacteria bacterium RIFCSPLOWO2_01_FULL_45_15b TaxID=1802319 RepID=A0A1G2NA82_9BACT|nr:MAG: hypothetical protein A2928_03800 [Candidatus Taylorbacteria bacterium RIFCSPLOWO2_01_FULL_45_15b]
MKTLNTFFATVYSFIFLASLWFGINWATTRGINSMFDNLIEFFFALLYIIALLYSVFMHVRLRSKQGESAHKILLILTSINTLALAVLILKLINIHNDDGLLVAGWAIVIAMIWAVCLFFGSLALAKK